MMDSYANHCPIIFFQVIILFQLHQVLSFYYLEYFVDSIEQDFVAYPNMEEGIGTVALLQAMDKSLQTGMPVKIADVLAEYSIEL